MRLGYSIHVDLALVSRAKVRNAIKIQHVGTRFRGSMLLAAAGEAGKGSMYSCRLYVPLEHM
jgi:hypothetical protein